MRMNIFSRTPPGNSPVSAINRSLIHILREGRCVITPELAKRILDESNYEGQRKVDDRSIIAYAEMMRRSLWDLTDPISFAVFNGSLILVNGQHRMHAVVKYGHPVEFRVAMNECNTEEQLRALYYRFDTVMRKRTNEQVLSAIALAAEQGVSRNIASATFRSVGIIANGFVVPSNYTIKNEAVAKLWVVDLRLEACTPWWHAARILEAAMKRGERSLRQKILRSTTFAIALLTARYQPEHAEQFWRGVAENDGLKRGDPRHTFVNDLKSRDAGQGSVSQGLASAAIAWNAYVERRRIQVIKVPDDYNLRVAGTPVGSRRS